MNPTELDRMIAASAPVTDGQVRGWDLAAAERDLIEEIMSTQLTPSAGTASTDEPTGPTVEVGSGADSAGRPRSRRRRLVPALAVVAAAAVVVAGVVIARSGAGDTTDVQQEGSTTTTSSEQRSGYTAEDDRAAAEPLPHLLPDLSSWTVDLAMGSISRLDDTITATAGEVRFERGDRVLSLLWRPAGSLAEQQAEIVASSTEPVTIAGHDATLYVLTAPTSFIDRPSSGEGPRTLGDDHIALWLQDDQLIVARGWGFGDATGEFEQTLAGLAETDVETWMDAVSPAVVWPSAHASTVEEMLADVPRPPGLDVSAPATNGGLVDRRLVALSVSNAVACRWIGSWVEGNETGDQAAVQEAVDALATVDSWSVLAELDDAPGWSQVDELATGVVDGSGFPEGTSGMTVGELYEAALGC